MQNIKLEFIQFMGNKKLFFQGAWNCRPYSGYFCAACFENSIYLILGAPVFEILLTPSHIVHMITLFSRQHWFTVSIHYIYDLAALGQ